jgi:hypothetical protein
METVKKINFFTITNYEELEYYSCNINLLNLVHLQQEIDNWTYQEQLKNKKNQEEKHPLSIKCNDIMNVDNEIAFSYLLRQIVEWDTDNINELKFQKGILNTMIFTKIKYHDMDKLYNEKLIQAYPWLEISFNKLDFWKEIRSFFSNKRNIFTKIKIKKCLIKNLPYSNNIVTF